MSRMLMRSIGTAGWVLLGVILLPWAATAKPKEVIYVQCPSVFPEPGPTGVPLTLQEAEDWDGLARDMVGPGEKDYITDDDDWYLNCMYETGRQVIVPITHGAKICDYSRKGGHFAFFCKGPASDKPVPPQQVFVARPLDYGAQWGGFGLRESPAAILAAAQAQGLTAMAREEEIEGAKRIVEIDLTEKPFAILFSPRTGLSREVIETWRYEPYRWTPKPMNRIFLQYGPQTHYLDALNGDKSIDEGYSWDQEKGVRLEWRWNGHGANPPSASINLIDIAQTELDGLPVRHEGR